MQILLVNRFLGGKQVPTGRMLKDLAVELSERGHNVQALVSNGSYVSALERTSESVEIDTKKLWTFNDKSRVLSWILFWLQSIILIPFLRWDRCIILTDPPFMPVAARLCKWLHPKRKVYWWTMDLYPEALVADGILTENGIIYRLLCAINNFSMSGLDGIISLGPRQKKRLSQYSGWQKVSGQNLVCPPWDYRPLEKVHPENNRLISRFGWHGKKVVLYAGNIGHAHTYKDIVDAARLLYEKGDKEVIFAFFCRGAKREALKSDAANLPNVVVSDYVPPEETAELLHSADVHLITMQDGWEGIVVPSKLYGVIKTGAPILFIGPRDADTAEEIRTYGAGIVLLNECGGAAVKDALEQIMHTNGVDYDGNKQNTPQEIAKFILQ